MDARRVELQHRENGDGVFIFAGMAAFFLLFCAIGLLSALRPRRANDVLNKYKVPVSFAHPGKSTPRGVRAIGICFAVFGAGFFGVLVWYGATFGVEKF